MSTDCGRDFKHTWHIYVTERGKVKVCDGDLEKRNEGKDEEAKRRKQRR
jgi:hypothetical protein